MPFLQLYFAGPAPAAVGLQGTDARGTLVVFRCSAAILTRRVGTGDADQAGRCCLPRGPPLGLVVKDSGVAGCQRGRPTSRPFSQPQETRSEG
jgi:hypothetical protein